MRTEAEIRLEGIEALVQALDVVDAARFVALIHQVVAPPFGATAYHRDGFYSLRTRLGFHGCGPALGVVGQMDVY